MENKSPSTCQYKMLTAECRNIEEKNRLRDQISRNWQSFRNQISENWDIEDWESNLSPRFQYIQYTVMQKKRISAANINDLTPLWRLKPHELERVKKSNENMTHIVRQLINKEGCIFVGNWVCFGDGGEKVLPCCKNNKWQELIERESLIKYLVSEGRLVEQHEFFRKECNRCHKKRQITSFFLYTSVMDVEVSQIDYYSSQIKRHRCIAERPDIEVICHLVWKKHYRVFGNWRCSNRRCQNEWVSAYTWMSLRNFINQTPANSLQHDFYVQECKKCEGKYKSKGRIWKYDPLELSDGVGPHKSHLCARCQHKEYCSESGTYFG